VGEQKPFGIGELFKSQGFKDFMFGKQNQFVIDTAPQPIIAKKEMGLLPHEISPDSIAKTNELNIELRNVLRENNRLLGALVVSAGDTNEISKGIYNINKNGNKEIASYLKQLQEKRMERSHLTGGQSPLPRGSEEKNTWQ